jgi:hypothetical protein
MINFCWIVHNEVKDEGLGETVHIHMHYTAGRVTSIAALPNAIDNRYCSGLHRHSAIALHVPCLRDIIWSCPKKSVVSFRRGGDASVLNALPLGLVCD